MSMGYDHDDPRDKFYRDRFDDKIYQLKPGDKPVSRFKRSHDTAHNSRSKF